jgi:hypothetical protein
VKKFFFNCPEFSLYAAGNGTGPEVVSLKPGESTVLTFSLSEADIGGTLAVEMAIIHPRVSTLQLNLP